MRQRALIAIALACQPRLLIADEPTTALDVTIQAQILELLRELVRETGAALIMITHDLGVVAGLCDMVNVLYGGRIVERAQRNRLFGTPRHPYTHGLLRSIPRLDAPAGEPLEADPRLGGGQPAVGRGLRVRAALRRARSSAARDVTPGVENVGRAAAALPQPGPGERGVTTPWRDARCWTSATSPCTSRSSAGSCIDRTVGPRLRGRRGVADHRPRRDLRAGRRVRLRQVDARPDHPAAGATHRRPGALRRPGHRAAAGRGAAPAAPPVPDGVPGPDVQPGPAAVGGVAAHRGHQGARPLEGVQPRTAPGCASWSTRSGCRRPRCAATRTSSPAASASGSASPARCASSRT